MKRRVPVRVATAVVAAAVLHSAPISADPSTFHLIVVNEVFSNADGTIQFVELKALEFAQTAISFTHLESVDSAGTDTTMVFDFTLNFPQLGKDETLLLATAGAAAALGFNPDFTIAANSIPIGHGKVTFDRDGLGGEIDAVAYGAYAGSNTGFGSPAASPPSDGCRSLQRVVYNTVTRNNANDFASAVNSPTRNNGTTGTLPCPPTPPELAPIGPKSTNEGQALNFTVTATDINGTIPVVTYDAIPIWANFVDNHNGTGSFSGTPDYNQSGIYTPVTFIATDGALADSEAVTITVIEVDNYPVARDTTAGGLEDTPLPLQFQAYDPDGDSLVYRIISVTFGGGISGFDSLSGSLTWNPSPETSGNAWIKFRVNDGLLDSDTAQVSIVILPVNDPPVARDVIAATLMNDPTTVGAMPVTDVDDVAWTISQVGGPFHGVVQNFAPSTGAFDFIPELDYSGPDSIQYLAYDGEDASNIAVIRINILGSCTCACHADPVCDSIDNVQDLVAVVGVAFRNMASTFDPDCPRERSDVDCSGATDVLDVVKTTGVVFRGDDPIVVYCNACLP